ncbi:MAG: RidA family protein [Armatimonadota bacterium]
MTLDRLTSLGLILPAAPTPLGVYVPAVRSGNLIFLSGQLPLVEGKLPLNYAGKLGADITVEDGQAAARQATLNALAILHQQAGLDSIRRIIRLAGHVNSAPDFTQQPQVLNAASELLGAVFGDAGIHARLALGAAALPLNACIEIELIVEVNESDM